MLLDADAVGAEWPVLPGRYVARLLIDDGYEVLAEMEPFTITE